MDIQRQTDRMIDWGGREKDNQTGKREKRREDKRNEEKEAKRRER